jgi:type I restriction enzyme, S subunit
MQPGFAQRPNVDNMGVPQLRTNNISPEGIIDLSSLAYVRANDQDIDKYGLRKGDVLFNNTNSIDWVGKTAYFDLEGTYLLSNHMTRIRVLNDLLDPQFLALYLHSLWQLGVFRRAAKHWVNQAAIDQTELGRVELPLPTLGEQRRIADILRKSSILLSLRRDSEEKRDQFLRSLFHDMFGDCYPNGKYPEGWTVLPFESLISSTQYGISTNLSEVGDVAVLRMNNISEDGWLDFTDLKFLPQMSVDFSQYDLRPGDILFNRTNSRELVGKTALWGEREGLFTFASYIIRVRVTNQVLPEYVWALLNSMYGKSQVFRLGKQAVNMANINVKELGSIPIVLPPKPLQERFARFYVSFSNHLVSTQGSLQGLQSLSKSLISRAFTGELTTSWRERHEQELTEVARLRNANLDQRDRVVALAELSRRRMLEEETELRQTVSLNIQPIAQQLIQSATSPASLAQAIGQGPFSILTRQIQGLSLVPAETTNLILTQGIQELQESVQSTLAAMAAPIAIAQKQWSGQISGTLDDAKRLAQSQAFETAKQLADLAKAISSQARANRRYHLLTVLGDDQTAVYSATTFKEGYFTPQSLTDELQIDITTTQRTLSLLAACGLVMPVSLPIVPGDTPAVILAYRSLRREDNALDELITPNVAGEESSTA